MRTTQSCHFHHHVSLVDNSSPYLYSRRAEVERSKQRFGFPLRVAVQYDTAPPMYISNKDCIQPNTPQFPNTPSLL